LKLFEDDVTGWYFFPVTRSHWREDDETKTADINWRKLSCDDCKTH